MIEHPKVILVLVRVKDAICRPRNDNLLLSEKTIERDSIKIVQNQHDHLIIAVRYMNILLNWLELETYPNASSLLK